MNNYKTSYKLNKVEYVCAVEKNGDWGYCQISNSIAC